MDTRQYDVESAVEAHHWWYVNRRRLLAHTLKRCDLPKNALVLDAGCGTGPNLRLLHNMGLRAVAFDRSQNAVAYCRNKGFTRLARGDLESMPYPDAVFDIVLSTDTMGYLRGTAALEEMRRVVKPGGIVIVTAPALKCLWGQNDDDIGHVHRYKRTELRDLITTAGLHIEELYYFNYLLFLPIFCVRALVRHKAKWGEKRTQSQPLITQYAGQAKTTMGKNPTQSESQMTPGWINTLLSAMFYVDIMTARHIRPPAGVSLMVVARRPQTP